MDLIKDQWYKVELLNKFYHYVNFSDIDYKTAYLTDAKYIKNLKQYDSGMSIEIKSISNFWPINVNEIKHLLPKNYKFNQVSFCEIYY